LESINGPSCKALKEGLRGRQDAARSVPLFRREVGLLQKAIGISQPHCEVVQAVPGLWRNRRTIRQGTERQVNRERRVGDCLQAVVPIGDYRFGGHLAVSIQVELAS
jgi:hypothetical protein